MFRKLKGQLPSTAEEGKKHLDALREMLEAEDHQKVFGHLYECLSILDAKSSSLLTFNSIIIAVFAIFLSQGLSLPELVVAYLGMIAVLVSAVLLLWVVWVHWSTTDHLEDANSHAATLLTVRKERTILYRLAWNLATGAILCMVVFLLLRLIAELRGTV